MEETHLSGEEASVKPVYAVSQKNKKIGLFFLIGPVAGLITILIVYALSSFAIASLNVGTKGIVVAQLINVILGLLGIICFIGMLLGFPFGILYLNKKELVDGARFDERSGKKGGSIVPEEIKGWNWGAAGLTWIWGVYHGVWISLLAWIPLINVVMIIVLGIKGNEWTWRARKWESVESFLSSQKKWKPWGMLFFAFAVLGIILSILLPES
jgi:hypothetical protein